MPIPWSDAVLAAVRRLADRTAGGTFSRQDLIDTELPRIVLETQSTGLTPAMTLSRELQQLRDRGIVEFVGPGSYRLTERTAIEQGTSKGVFVIAAASIYRDEPERFYRFPQRWLSNAAKVAGNWIVYQEPRRAGNRGYYAVAKVERIVPDPADPALYLGLIEPGSFLEFGRDVPFQLEGRAVERALLNADGRLNNGRAIQSIRPLSDEDFNRIVGLGLIEEDELLPRIDDDSVDDRLHEEHAVWEGPIDRATMLTNRTVRDRQFRKRVLDAYQSTCAFTGMKLINGGGRAETQAAHIMSVKAGGPDVANNGIALSGTMHWMFDRGLITVSDDGDILLSRAINDIESVERLIYKDRKARLPVSASDRPHVRYLHWHRTECFH